MYIIIYYILSAGLSMYEEIGFKEDKGTGHFLSRHCSHMDAFYWVQRDSYLPVGSQVSRYVLQHFYMF